jgi:hypothetical protein
MKSWRVVLLGSLDSPSDAYGDEPVNRLPSVTQTIDNASHMNGLLSILDEPAISDDSLQTPTGRLQAFQGKLDVEYKLHCRSRGWLSRMWWHHYAQS